MLRIYAGYDETTIWQEFGEMKFETKEEIPDDWGNPDPLKPNWVVNRYVPWTSWRAGAQQWGHSSIRQGESSGTITHEIVHTFGLPDNNNNPYIHAVSPRRHRARGTSSTAARSTARAARTSAGWCRSPRAARWRPA